MISLRSGKRVASGLEEPRRDRPGRRHVRPRPSRRPREAPCPRVSAPPHRFPRPAGRAPRAGRSDDPRGVRRRRAHGRVRQHRAPAAPRRPGRCCSACCRGSSGKYVLCPLRWHGLSASGRSRRWHLRVYAESELMGLLTPGPQRRRPVAGAPAAPHRAWTVRPRSRTSRSTGSSGAVGLALFVVAGRGRAAAAGARRRAGGLAAVVLVARAAAAPPPAGAAAEPAGRPGPPARPRAGAVDGLPADHPRHAARRPRRDRPHRPAAGAARRLRRQPGRGDPAGRARRRPQGGRAGRRVWWRSGVPFGSALGAVSIVAVAAWGPALLLGGGCLLVQRLRRRAPGRAAGLTPPARRTTRTGHGCPAAPQEHARPLPVQRGAQRVRAMPVLPVRRSGAPADPCREPRRPDRPRGACSRRCSSSWSASASTRRSVASAAPTPAAAVDHAHDLVALERALGIYWEPALQRAGAAAGPRPRRPQLGLHLGPLAAARRRAALAGAPPPAAVPRAARRAGRLLRHRAGRVRALPGRAAAAAPAWACSTR